MVVEKHRNHHPMISLAPRRARYFFEHSSANSAKQASNVADGGATCRALGALFCSETTEHRRAVRRFVACTKHCEHRFTRGPAPAGEDRKKWALRRKPRKSSAALIPTPASTTRDPRNRLSSSPRQHAPRRPCKVPEMNRINRVPRAIVARKTGPTVFCICSARVDPAITEYDSLVVRSVVPGRL